MGMSFAGQESQKEIVDVRMKYGKVARRSETRIIEGERERKRERRIIRKGERGNQRNDTIKECRIRHPIHWIYIQQVRSSRIEIFINKVQQVFK